MDSECLQAARGGDRRAFDALVEPHLAPLTTHCYRMVGSLHDAEDMLQETLLRAWQGLPTFEGRSSLRTWLYKIATNACLDLATRRQRSLPTLGPAGDAGAPVPKPIMEPVWIEPLPDELVPAGDPDPEVVYGAREGVALAFVALLQALPGRQRAVLVLRDVVGFTAGDAAEMLGTSVAAVNSALQRARETLEQHRAPAPSLGEGAISQRELVDRFVRAWDTSNLDALVSCLRADVRLSMPPVPLWLAGPGPIRAFFESALFREPLEGRFRALPTRANGCPAVGIYERDAQGHRPIALDVLALEADGIRDIIAFLAIDPQLSFERFGLPARLDR